jgi:peptide/nickel transport system substrate-binding protein
MEPGVSLHRGAKQTNGEALELSMKDSVRVWLVHQTAPWASRKDVSLTYDLAGGYSGARLWPYTIRYVDKVGGSLKIASSDLLVEPINPVGGSNWVYDAMFYRLQAIQR